LADPLASDTMTIPAVVAVESGAEFNGYPVPSLAGLFYSGRFLANEYREKHTQDYGVEGYGEQQSVDTVMVSIAGGGWLLLFPGRLLLPQRRKNSWVASGRLHNGGISV